ncbi:MAG: LON peptidase substrate-binding domain-containing protein [Mycobacteriales bacterium]
MSNSLPLFPLGSVLFPGVMLPLHVFEQRYRALMQSLLDRPGDRPRQFGVITLRAGDSVDPDAQDPAAALHTVGCMAELREVDSKSDGTYDVLTVGVRRFRLLSVDGSRAPYLIGHVDWLPAEPEPGPEADLLASHASALFRGYLEAITATGSVEVTPADLPTDPALLSYLIASATLLSTDDRQRLLECPATTDRLRLEAALLRRETVFLRELHAVPMAVSEYSEEPSSN